MRFRIKSCILLSSRCQRFVFLCVFFLMAEAMLLASSNLTFSPAEATFGTVVIGETKTIDVEVTNVSGKPITISGITITGFASFSVVSECPTQIPAGNSCTMRVSFHPVSGGGYHGEQRAVIIFYDGTAVLASLDADGHAL
jgi:hypothetical protein